MVEDGSTNSGILELMSGKGLRMERKRERESGEGGGGFRLKPHTEVRFK